VLRENGSLISTTQFKLTQKTVHPYKKDAAEQAREYIHRHWRFREPKRTSIPADANPDSSFQCDIPSDNFLERAQSHYLCISGMAFQDAWNVDLQRLKRCCIHVVTPELKRIPFCVYYMTDINGRRLVAQSE